MRVDQLRPEPRGSGQIEQREPERRDCIYDDAADRYDFDNCGTLVQLDT
jgi:hypothetical protein